MAKNNKKIIFDVCVRIMIRVLLNPCIGPINADISCNPKEIKYCLEFFRDNKEAKSIVEDSLADSEQIELNCLRGGSWGENGLSEYDKTAVDEYESALKSLKEVVELF